MKLNRFALGFLFLLMFHTVFAAEISDAAIEEQQDDQSLCVQQRMSQCLNTCQSQGEADCDDLCEENVKNECRQAGE
ncbi:hypothetical protein [Legionella impletisoli]|uniref:Uncharacterized protein n=1 Tax=Legionella impletisoli TaxID=343510 RepID=A0A917N9U9_9GAMM|nr:hypothetical protein [Legionella impletisoli]GGI81639.1 hypothetical protein GCM10007966_07660 [Legionella impletisoli]